MGEGAVVTRTRDDCKMRVSFRFKRQGVNIETIGWPFARLRISSEQVHVTAFAVLYWQKIDWKIPRNRIQKIERTQNGIRLYVDGFDSPWVCGSLFGRRFLLRLQECGFEITGPIIKSTWTKL